MKQLAQEGKFGRFEGSEIRFLFGADPVGVSCNCGQIICRAYPVPGGAWGIHCLHNHAEGCSNATAMDERVKHVVEVVDSMR